MTTKKAERHTPGPWRYDDMAARLVRGRGATVCEMVPQEAAEANGRLIAQAPAMLDIIRRLADRIYTVGGGSNLSAEARAILAAIEEGE